MRTIKNVQIPGSLLGRFKGESKGYRPVILSYKAKTFPLTKFGAERSLADTEEGDENENSSFLHSTAKKHRQAQVNVVRWVMFRCCGKRCILLNGDRRKDDNSQQFSRPSAEFRRKLSEPRVNVPQAESVKNYC